MEIYPDTVFVVYCKFDRSRAYTSRTTFEVFLIYSLHEDYTYKYDSADRITNPQFVLHKHTPKLQSEDEVLLSQIIVLKQAMEKNSGREAQDIFNIIPMVSQSYKSFLLTVHESTAARGLVSRLVPGLGAAGLYRLRYIMDLMVQCTSAWLSV